MSTSALRVTGISKDFGGLKAVDEIDFEVRQGEFVGLIGPNGCGKTTTFNLISGLLERDGGEIEVFDSTTAGLHPNQISRLGLCRTFQHTRLWREMTVIDNLMIPPKKQFGSDPFRALLTPFRRDDEQRRLARAYEVLDSLEIGHTAHLLAGELSGGQSKLVDIGRALMSDAPFLLLDEPVAGVAGPLAAKIFLDIQRLVRDEGRTVLVIEHNMEFILRKGVDRVIVMDAGRVLMVGTPEEVQASHEVKEAYLGGALLGEEE